MAVFSLLAPWIGFLRAHWLLTLLAAVVLRTVYRKYLHPLRSVPGPWLASSTNLWRLGVFLRGRQHFEYLDLHDKYGPVVRLGPDTVIFNDPAHFNEFFGWDKSPWWSAFWSRMTDRDHSGILETKEHVIAKRGVMGGYSMSNIIKSESRVDVHITDLMNQFTRRCGTIVDLVPWTQWAAFDIAMDVAFSNPVGFVKSGSDVGGLIASLHELLTAVGIVALFPRFLALLHSPLVWPSIAPNKTDKNGPGALYALAWGQVEKRFQDQDIEKHSDILQWLIDHEDRDGQRLSKGLLEMESTAPVLAGSDSSSTVVRAATLYVATNPRVLGKLRAEIDAADAGGLLSTPPQFEEIRQYVPYVAAIMREALRIYPVFGSPSFRSVPRGGAHVGGYYLPGGTEIGHSQYAVGRNPGIFGDDANSFRPERWTEEVDPATKHQRENGDVFFGSGPMICSGRNVAILEIHKILTQLFRQFDVEVVNPVKPWKEKDSMFMLIQDFFVKLDLRKSVDG